MSDHSQVLADCQAGDVAPRAARIGLIVGVIGLIAGAVWSYLVKGDQESRTQFWYAYLTAFFWALTIGLGSMLFTVIMHLVGAHWSVSVRRLAEVTQSALPVLCLLGLPLLYPLLSDDVTVWRWAAGGHDDAHAVEAPVQDLGTQLAQDEHHHLGAHKLPYLNVTFLLIRFAIYGLIWWRLSRYYLQRSVQQDTAQGFEPTRRMRKWSAPTVILFALTISFASFDLLMSLDETWFSTMFGVNIFAGAFMSSFAWVILMAKYLQSKGRMTQVVNTEHYHDLGKMMFAFICFWGYTGFSQFMLIWYANMPEETHWFQYRISPAWIEWSWLMMFGHFMLPFIALMSRHVKRNKHALTFWAAYMLLMHWVDIYWIVMPSLEASATAEHNPVGPMDFALLIGMAGLLVWAVARKLDKQSLVPVGDPLLDRCLHFKNA